MPVFLQYVHLSVHVFFEQIIFITSKTVLPSTTVTVVSLNIMPFWGRKAFFSGRSLSMLSRIVWQLISIVQVTVLIFDVVFWEVVFGVVDLDAEVIFFAVVVVTEAVLLVVELALVTDASDWLVKSVTSVDNSVVLSTLDTVTPQPERIIKRPTRITDKFFFILSTLSFCSKKLIFFSQPIKSIFDVRRCDEKKYKGRNAVNCIEANARNVDGHHRFQAERWGEK